MDLLRYFFFILTCMLSLALFFWLIVATIFIYIPSIVIAYDLDQIIKLHHLIGYNQVNNLVLGFFCFL